MGGCDSAIPNFAMTRDANLSGENHFITDFGRSREADLSAEQRIFANFAAVTNLDKIIHLCARADTRFANAGAVNASVCLDLDPVAEDCGAGLDNLLPVIVFIFGEAEAVGTDDNTVLQDDGLAQLAVFADYGVRVSEEVVANTCAAVDDDVRQNDATIANDYVFVDDHVRADGGTRADSRRCMNLRCGMDAGLVFGRLIEKCKGASEGQVRVRTAQGRQGSRREILRNDDRGCFGCLYRGSIFWVGDKGDMPGPSFFDTGDSGDLGIIAIEAHI